MARLTTGNEGRRIFFFALPILLGQVFQQLYQVIDAVFMGQFVGKEAMAAAGASFPIIFLLISLLIGITMGTTTVVAQNYGAKNYDNVRKAIDSIYIFTFFASIGVAILGILFSKNILRLIQLPEELIPQASLFLDIFLLSMPFQFIFNGTSAILRGLGNSKVPMYFTIFATLLNILFAFLFVVLFHWGIAGAAWATFAATGIASVLIILYLNKTSELLRIKISQLKFDKKIFGQSFRIGLPVGLQQSFVAIGMLALNSIVNLFGTDVIAAYTAAGRIETFATMPAMNFAIALTAFVGQNLGANRLDRIRRGLRATLIMSSAVTVFFSLVNIFFGPYLLEWFLKDEKVIEIGHQYLIITGAFYIFFTVMQTYASVMRGAGDTVIPMFITLCSLWLIRIPVAWVLSRYFGEIGIWWAIPIAWGCGMIGAYIYYQTGRWQTKRVVTPPTPLIE